MGNGRKSDRPLWRNVDVAFFDIDIRGAVFAHGAELNEMAVGPQFFEREQEIQGSDDVVDLRKYRMFAVDHRIGRRPLLGIMNHCIRLEIFDDAGKKFVVVYIADEKPDGFARKFMPDAQTVGEGLDWRKRLRA